MSWPSAKRAEEALQKSRDERLELRVSERTAELAKVNQDMLIEINRGTQTGRRCVERQ